ncbi:MAG: transglutaminase-like domain-containing protein [Proteobacteria bacterium]|nr:transglutaminase-like domain-containing protein [Pseudomonadota bacterium]
MKVPPLIIGVALLFWGVETDNLLVGALLCLLLEGHNLATTRYTLTEDDFIKVSDLTSLIFLGSLALVLLNHKPINFLRITAGWLPFILSPLIVAQLYSTSDKIVIGTRLTSKKKIHAHKPIDFRFYYLAICIFAAATGNSRALWFYPVMGFILAWFLYQNRGRSFSSTLFVILLGVSLGFGYAAIMGMELAQSHILAKVHHFWRGYYREKNSDPYKSHVNFGETGRLKVSGEIIMRVDAPYAPPHLFKEASYSLFARGNWLGTQADFAFLAPVEEASWNLVDPPHKEGKTLSVQYNLPKEKGLLPYPHGGYHIKSNTIFEIEKNRNGVVKVIDGASIISYDLWYHPEMQIKTDLPTARNLIVPENERYVLQEVIGRIDVAGFSDINKIAALQQYFKKDFSYSLSFLGKEEYDTPLGNFLLKQKTGFCEYYATATALLLRLYGIPSRYVVGYAILEKSWLERKYVVRERHAHAWAEAFVDNSWIVVDTTPANWAEKDLEEAPTLETIQDIFRLIRHQYGLFRIGSGTENTFFYSTIVIVLTSFLVIRIYRRMRIKQAGGEKKVEKVRSFERIISPFSPIMDICLQSDVMRREKESFVDWVVRIYQWNAFDRMELKDLYHLHLRMRYDPEGLGVEEVERLRQGSEKYLEEIGKAKRPAGGLD